MLPIRQIPLLANDLNLHESNSAKTSRYLKKESPRHIKYATDPNSVLKQEHLPIFPSLVFQKNTTSGLLGTQNAELGTREYLSFDSSQSSVDTFKTQFPYHWRSAVPHSSYKQSKEAFSTTISHSEKRAICPSALIRSERENMGISKSPKPPKYPSSPKTTPYNTIKDFKEIYFAGRNLHGLKSFKPNSPGYLDIKVSSPPSTKNLQKSTSVTHNGVSSAVRNSHPFCRFPIGDFKEPEVNHSSNESAASTHMVPVILEALRGSQRFKHLIDVGFQSPTSHSFKSPPPASLTQMKSSSPLATAPSPIIRITTPACDPENLFLIKAGCLDCTDFLVPMSAIEFSKTLLHILKYSMSFLEYTEGCIRLPSIDPAAFQYIIQCLTTPNSTSSVPPDELILEIAEAAFYLNLPQIVDLCVKRGVALLDRIETLNGLSTPLLHILLKQLSIDQLLYVEKELLSKDSSFDMKPYWLSHLHKNATPILSFEKCFPITEDSIRSFLHPSLLLPSPKLLSFMTSFKLNSEKRYHLPSGALSDSFIIAYRDVFERHNCRLQLILKKCADLTFSAFSVVMPGAVTKKAPQKYVRMRPDASMTVGEGPSSELMKEHEPVDYSEVSFSSGTAGSGAVSEEALIIEISGTQLQFASRNQFSIFTSWPITHLKLEDSKISPSQLSIFCQWLQSALHLKSISIHRCFEASQLGFFFQTLSYHPSLINIDVSLTHDEREKVQDKSVLKGLASLVTIPHLTQLHLHHLIFLPAFLKGALEAIQTCHLGLVHLQLSHLRLGTQITPFIEVTWPHLTHLELQDASLPPCTLITFMEQVTTSFPMLLRLNLSYNAFTTSVLDQLCRVLPITGLTHFSFNLLTPVNREDDMYLRFFSHGLPTSLIFLELENHPLPWHSLIHRIPTRSMYLYCSMDSRYRRELKQKIKHSDFPIVIWCDDTILTNLPLKRHSKGETNYCK